MSSSSDSPREMAERHLPSHKSQILAIESAPGVNLPMKLLQKVWWSLKMFQNLKFTQKKRQKRGQRVPWGVFWALSPAQRSSPPSPWCPWHHQILGGSPPETPVVSLKLTLLNPKTAAWVLPATHWVRVLEIGLRGLLNLEVPPQKLPPLKVHRLPIVKMVAGAGNCPAVFQVAPKLSEKRRKCARR